MRIFKKNRSQPSLLNTVEGRSQSRSDSPLPSPAYLTPPQHGGPAPAGGQSHHQPGIHNLSSSSVDSDHLADVYNHERVNPAAQPHNSPQQFYNRGQNPSIGFTQHPQPQPQQHHPDSPPDGSVSHIPGHNRFHVSRPSVSIVGPSTVPALASASDESPQHPYAASQPYPYPRPQTPEQTEQQEPRKSKRSFFGIHTSKDNPPKALGRNLSVRKPAPPSQYRPPQGQPQTPVQGPAQARRSQDVSRELADAERLGSSHSIAQDSLEDRNQMRQQPSRFPQIPQAAFPQEGEYSQQLPSPGVHRTNTEPFGRESYYQRENDSYQNQVSDKNGPRFHPEIIQPSPQRSQFADAPAPPRKLSIAHVPPQPYPPPDPASLQTQPSQLENLYPRPSSQQSFGPPSPLPPQYQASDPRPQQSQPQPQPQQGSGFRQSLQPSPAPTPQPGMSPLDRPSGLRQPADMVQQQQQLNQGRDQGGNLQYVQNPPGLPQGASMKSNLSQQDQERGTPPPISKRDDTADIDVRALLAKHEELQAKYTKVKKYYFEKDAQVQQLQNTVAHQRMATSRTVLDDNEYATRFSRLDGAINNLAFNIRKDWKSVPPWLRGVVNEDAHHVGTKEMTAVGRACITRWIVDEIFDRYFHPGLEPGMSSQLKIIEKNVRRQGNTASEEDRDNHTSKVSTWRRTTLEGLAEALQSSNAEEIRAQLTRKLVEKLMAALEMDLNDPPPPGLDNSLLMIVELAIGITANMPQESREIIIGYPMPGTPIDEGSMKVETTLPPLTHPADDRADQASTRGSNDNHDSAMGDSEKDITRDSSSTSTASSQTPQQPPSKEAKKKSVFGNLISKKPHPNAVSTGGSGSVPSGAASLSRPGSAAAKERDEKGAETEGRVRFAAFISVEVHGKGAPNVLVKAPVYSLP